MSNLVMFVSCTCGGNFIQKVQFLSKVVGNSECIVAIKNCQCQKMIKVCQNLWLKID